MIELSATNIQPVSAADRRETGFVTSGLPYIPGWTVRGGLAAAWIAENGKPSVGSSCRDEFVSLFESDVRFGALLPVGAAFEPLSVVACKYPQLEGCTSFLLDRAYEQSTAECRVCGGPVEPLKGRLRHGALEQRSHVQLDEHGRALDHALFARSEVPSGTVMTGAIDGFHPWLISEMRRVWFGGRRSTSGYTEVVSRAGQSNAYPELDRVSPTRLVIRCSSPLIAVGRFGEPLLGPSTEEIAHHLQVDVRAVELRQQFTRTDTIGGWHMASGLPKPRELAVVAGATFVYSVAGLTEEMLARLASTGIGLRTREGFGWIQVNPGPWSAPEAPSRGVRSPASSTTTPPSVSALRALPESERKWVAGHLDGRLRVLDSGGGRHDPLADDLEQLSRSARFLRMQPLEREQFVTALRIGDRLVMQRVIAHIRGGVV